MGDSEKKKSTVPVSILDLLKLLLRALELGKVDVAKLMLQDAIRQTEEQRDRIKAAQQKSEEGEGQAGEGASPQSVG